MKEVEYLAGTQWRSKNNQQIYKYLFISTYTETGNTVVNYESVLDNTRWTTPETVWNQMMVKL